MGYYRGRGANRSYDPGDYYVYRQPNHSGEAIKVVGDLREAKRIAKSLGIAYAAIYSVSGGRFVGYISPTGRYVPTRRGR